MLYFFQKSASIQLLNSPVLYFSRKSPTIQLPNSLPSYRAIPAYRAPSVQRSPSPVSSFGCNAPW